MKKTSDSSLPKHLEELMSPTPSGTAKLIAAWDGLMPEHQILILHQLKNTSHYAYLIDKVRMKALKSPIPYVRYLAARECHFFGEDDEEKSELQQLIENDPEPLVRNSLLETKYGSNELDDPDVFFNLSHEARLAVVRCLRGEGEKISSLISYGVDHQLRKGDVSEYELFEILSDYLIRPEFKEKYKEDSDSGKYYDYFGEYLEGKDIECLWELVVKVPEWISYVLIENLPEKTGLNTEIPEDVLNGMNDEQLSKLLYRSEIPLRELRRKMFFEFNHRSPVAHSVGTFAAICCNFDLEYSEFGNILSQANKIKIKTLENLTNARDLSLCLHEAIHDIFYNSELTALGSELDDAGKAKFNFELKLGSLKEGWFRDKQLLELRLYRLAKEAAPWGKEETGYPPDGEINFLKEEIVEDDTWATFMAFSNKWGNLNERRKKDLEKFLPLICEIGEEDNYEEDILDDEDDTNKPEVLAEQIHERLSEINAAIKNGDDEKYETLEDKLQALTDQNANFRKDTLQSFMALNESIKTLYRSQSIYLIVIIALFLWVLLFG